MEEEQGGKRKGNTRIRRARSLICVSCLLHTGTSFLFALSSATGRT